MVGKRPTEIGSMWMGANKRLIHGPRFFDPRNMKRIWLQTGDKSYPRYLLGETNSGAVVIQSVLRPVYPGEMPYFDRLIRWNGHEYEFPTLKIRPFATYEHAKYTFYSFSFTRSILESLINHVNVKNYYRVKDINASGIKIYVLYRRGKA